MAEHNIGDSKWKLYSNKNFGRHDFQIDLGLWLIEQGIREDWIDPRKKNKYGLEKRTFYLVTAKNVFL